MSKNRTLIDLAPGDLVRDQIVISVTRSSDSFPKGDVPDWAETAVTVSLTGSQYISGQVTDPAPRAEFPTSPSAMAERFLSTAQRLANKAREAWNATLPELPADLLDNDSQANCPHLWTEREAAEWADHGRHPRLVGEPCGAGLSFHLDAYETAPAYGWGESEWRKADGPVFRMGYGEDAESVGITSLSCWNSHNWQVPADVEAIG